MSDLDNQEYAAGFIGVVQAAGTDWNIMSWESTGTTKSTPITNTGCYDPVAKRCWEADLPTTSSKSGNFKFGYDKNNPPEGKIDDGKIVAADFTAHTGRGFTGKIRVESLVITNGGMENAIEVTCNWKSYGKITNK